MRARDKQKVPVKVKCSGCSVGTVVGDATIVVGTQIEQTCKHCGAKIRKTISKVDIERAIEIWSENREFTRRLEAGEVRESGGVSFYPRADRDRSLPRTAPTIPKRKVRGDQVVGGAKLYHYAIYVRHPWGTDRIVVGIQKQNVQKARDEAYDKVGRVRKTGDLKIMDAVPMKWTSEGMVETRKTRITTGKLSNARRPKSRPSARNTKRKVNDR